MRVSGRLFMYTRKIGLFIGVGVTIVLLLLLYRVSGVTWFAKNSLLLIQALITGLLQGGIYSLVAMGLALIFGVLDIINFAHGAFMTLAMYSAYVLVANAGLDPYLTLLIAIPFLFLLGFVLQRVLINRVMGQPTENQLLLTFGLSLLIGNILLLVFTGTPKAINNPFGQSNFSGAGITIGNGVIHILGAVADIPRVLAFLGSLLLVGILYAILRYTTLGIAVRAVSQNPEGAAMVGINVRSVYALTFGLGTACVGAAGALVLPFLSVEPTTGEQFTIIAFVVVALGGMGNVAGAFVGGLVIGLIQELAGVVFPNANKLLVVFALFIVILLFRPQGLFGRKL
jgi:branched-chain amino acid transport system permease protein